MKSIFNSFNNSYFILKGVSLKKSNCFLKKDLGSLIKTNYSISKIDQENQKIKLTFENNENFECDYLIISDGVFSKSKNLISNNQIQPKYNNSLAIRGILPSSSNVIDKDCVFIDHDASLQSAMEVASNFVGEIIPIIDTDRKKAIAVITEGAIFQAYLSKQNQTVEMEKR